MNLEIAYLSLNECVQISKKTFYTYISMLIFTTTDDKCV